MKSRDERAEFAKLLEKTDAQLNALFEVADNDSCFSFKYADHQEGYLTVSKEIDGVLVNADFGFARPAGSNNYPQLLELGVRLIRTFGLLDQVQWDADQLLRNI